MFYFNDKMLVVGDFIKILVISSEEISFAFKRFDLVIKGDALVIPYLEDKEVGIKGVIKNIAIKYRMVKDNA